jgi:hypothetical protein
MVIRLRTLASVHVTPVAHRGWLTLPEGHSLNRSDVCGDAPRAFRRLLIEIIAVR